MLKVRRARADEFDQVLDFYTNMIGGRRGTEVDVCWEHDVHPSSAFLRAAAEAGEVYVGLVEDGEGATCIASAMVLNGEGEAGYESVSWHVAAAPDEVLVVHVLGTLPAYHGRGFARYDGGVHRCRAGGWQESRASRHVHHQRARAEPLRVVRFRELRRLRRLLRPPRPLRCHVRVRGVEDYVMRRRLSRSTVFRTSCSPSLRVQGYFQVRSCAACARYRYLL